MHVVGQGHLTQAVKRCFAKKLAKADILSHFIPEFGKEKALLSKTNQFYNIVQVVITKKSKNACKNLTKYKKLAKWCIKVNQLTHDA